MVLSSRSVVGVGLPRSVSRRCARYAVSSVCWCLGVGSSTPKARRMLVGTTRQVQFVRWAAERSGPMVRHG